MVCICLICCTEWFTLQNVLGALEGLVHVAPLHLPLGLKVRFVLYGVLEDKRVFAMNGWSYQSISKPRVTL